MADEPKTGRLKIDQPFSLNRALDGTQSFRWCVREDGWYSGVLQGSLIHIQEVKTGLLEYRATARWMGCCVPTSG